MVHNAKQKFLAVSTILSFAIVGLLIGAIATPDWVSYSSQGDKPQFQGLFVGCKNGQCNPNKFDADGQGAFGSLGCKQNGGELQDRFHATAGTLLGGAALAALVVLFQLAHIFRLGYLSQAAHMYLFWTLIVSFVASLVGVAIFGGTINSWWNCGSDICQPYKNSVSSCDVGFGYVFCIAGCGITLLSAVVVVTFTKFPHVMFPTNDVVLLAVVLEVVAVTLIGVGVSTPEWIVVINNYASMGLFQSCGPHTCNSLNISTTQVTRTSCTIVGSSVTSRLSATGAILIVAAVIMAVFGVLFLIAHLRISTRLFMTNTKKRITIGCISLAMLLEVIGLIISTNVFDSYFFCGISFCVNYGTGYCRDGIAFGLCLAALLATVLLFVLHIFEFNSWCCFQERFASGRQSFSVWKVLKSLKTEASSDVVSKGKGSKNNTAAPTTEKEPIDENTIQLPSGQWDYDSVSGFYWSEELYLFFDPVTQQFYDPNKDEWFAQDRRTAAAGFTSPNAASTSSLKVSNSQVNRAGSFDRQGSQVEREMRTSPRRTTPRR